MEAARLLSCCAGASIVFYGAPHRSCKGDAGRLPSASKSSSLPSRIAVSPSPGQAGSVSAAVRVVRCAAAKREKSSNGASSSSSSTTKGRPASTGGGFGAKSTPKPTFDAGVLLRRSELLYSRLIEEYMDEGDVREFVVCVREKRSATGKSVLDDWLPVAELALVSEQDASVALPVLLPLVCREVAECAAKGAMALRSIPRTGLEYAYEPADAFYEHVLAGENLKLSSKECPYGILGLQRGASAAEVRAAYRSLAAKNHPDRHLGGDASAVEAEFKQVADAYDQIKRTGLASSSAPTYSSLGGTARNGLSEPIVISSSSSKISSGIPKDVKIAVRQLDPDIVTWFLSRMYARSSGAGA